MTNPDEKLWEVFQTVYEPGSRVSLALADRDLPDIIDGARAVAEWARKETLLEAATAVENIARHPRVGGSGIRLQDVIHTIRSLAGGVKA